jgi:hypothetical protein
MISLRDTLVMSERRSRRLLIWIAAPDLVIRHSGRPFPLVPCDNFYSIHSAGGARLPAAFGAKTPTTCPRPHRGKNKPACADPAAKCRGIGQA